MSRLLATVLGAAIAVCATATSAGAQGARDDEAANAVFGGFRAQLVDELSETRARLAAASEWVDDPDWYLVQTPDMGIVGVRRSRLDDYATLLADDDFAVRAEVMDDPVHAWDEEFSLALSLINARTGPVDDDPHEAAAWLASEYAQSAREKKAMLRLERQALRADRDELIAAIDAFDAVLAGIGIEPASVAADDVRPERSPLPEGPLELVIAFRDELVAGRVTVQRRISACRAALDREEIIALGTRDGLPGVVTFDMLTWPGYADFFEYVRETGIGWDVFEPEAAQLTPLRAALFRFQLWQDWPEGQMREIAERQVATRFDFPTAGEDRAICRPELELLRPERERLDAAIAAIDEYLLLVMADDATPGPEPSTPPTAEPAGTPVPDPFAEL